MDVPRRHRRQRDHDAGSKRRKTTSRGHGSGAASQEKLSTTRPAAAWLPTELVLEIVDRCDPATLIVCAATCRLLRRHILDPAFIDRLRVAAGRFAPSSRRLLGLFYRHYDGEPAAARPPPFTPTTSTPGVVRSPFAPDVFDVDGGGYTPVESRGGLVVLRRSALFAERAGLCVLDPVTGRRAFLPPPEVHQQSYALLLLNNTRDDADNDAAGHGVSGMFRRLVVVDLSGLLFRSLVRAQSFSPDDDGGGAWGPVVEAFTPDDLWTCDVARLSPVILVGVLHWLCTDQRTVLTFDSGTSEVGAVQFPHGHHLCRNMPLAEKQLLASTARGELSLLVVDRLVVSVWVLQATTATGDEWTRRAAVDLEKIMNVPAETVLRSQRLLSGIVQLEWAGEMSGAVVVAQVAGAGLMVLDLEAEEVVCTVRRSRNSSDTTSLLPFRYCPYERDLIDRLAAMAPLQQ